MAEDASRAKIARVAGVVVMLDIEFLTKRMPFAGAVIYRYRSGLLRPAVLQFVEERSSWTGEMFSSYDCDDLILRWCDTEALWSGIRVCDMPEARAAAPLFKELRPLFGIEPGQPTIILMRAAKYNEGHHSGAVVVDEALVSTQNLNAHIQYLARTSDLPGAKEICNQSSFRDYFRNWVEAEGEVGLPDLVREFERAILLYSEPGSVIFTPPAVSEADPSGRALVVSTLDQYMRSRDVGARAAFLRALAIKVARGWSDPEIVDDVLVASCRVLSKIVKRKGGRSTNARSVRASLETAILWCALALAWASRMSKSVPHMDMQPRLPILIEMDHLCHEFEGRLLDLNSDPLVGRWSELTSTNRPRKLEVDEDELISDPLGCLKLSLMIETDKSRSIPWSAKLNRALSTVVEQAPSTTLLVGSETRRNLLSFVDVMGQDHVISGIRKRFEENRHERPLILSGPPGSGKQALATLYARALLCEERAAGSIDPCGICSACRGFSRAGGFGYAEFDLSAPGILEQSREKIDQFRFQGFSDRRVVVLKNADHADDVMDVFLKTFEEKSTVSSYLVLANDERNVRAAALSRGARFRFRKIAESKARELVEQFLPSRHVSDQVVRLILLHGNGQPGLMWHLSQMLEKYDALTLGAAKELFNLQWGERAVEYFGAFFAREADEARKRLHLIDIDPMTSVERVRDMLTHIHRNEGCSEAALIDLDVQVKEIRCAAYVCAEKVGRDPDELWRCLARHWLQDVVIDSESLSEAGMEAELLLARV